MAGYRNYICAEKFMPWLDIVRIIGVCFDSLSFSRNPIMADHLAK